MRARRAHQIRDLHGDFPGRRQCQDPVITHYALAPSYNGPKCSIAELARAAHVSYKIRASATVDTQSHPRVGPSGNSNGAWLLRTRPRPRARQIHARLDHATRDARHRTPTHHAGQSNYRDRAPICRGHRHPPRGHLTPETWHAHVPSCCLWRCVWCLALPTASTPHNTGDPRAIGSRGTYIRCAALPAPPLAPPIGRANTIQPVAVVAVADGSVQLPRLRRVRRHQQLLRRHVQRHHRSA